MQYGTVPIPGIDDINARMENEPEIESDTICQIHGNKNLDENKNKKLDKNDKI